MSDRRLCCQPGCGALADYTAYTVRRGGGCGGPDPTADDTDACEAHLGALLGYQPGATNPEAIYWEVFNVEGEQP